MKALTVLQPWATPIALGIKQVENRGWAPPPKLIGQWFAIHAGKNAIDPYDDVESLRHCIRQMETPSARFPPLTLRKIQEHAGHVLAVARVLRVETDPEKLTADQRAWFVPGSKAWVLSDLKMLGTPVAIRGQQGLWDLPPDVERAVREQVGL